MPRRLDTTANVESTPSVVDLDVRVPRGQAVTLALGFGVLVALFVGGQAAGSDLAWWAVPLRAMWRGAQAGAGLFVALFLLHAVSERVARAKARGPVRQEMDRLDFDAPEPERPVVHARLELVAGNTHRLLDVDITPELCAFARRVLAWRADEDAPLGLSFAEASAGREGVTPQEFTALRDEMIARGVLRWKNPEHHLSGYEFRAGFDEAMRYVASYEMEV